MGRCPGAARNESVDAEEASIESFEEAMAIPGDYPVDDVAQRPGYQPGNGIEHPPPPSHVQEDPDGGR